MSQKRLFLTLSLIFVAAFLGLWLRGKQLLNQDAVAQRADVDTQADPNAAATDEVVVPGENHRRSNNGDDKPFTPTTKNPFIRALEELLGASPILESERDALQKQMQEADTVFMQAKEDGRSALRQANRQVRIRNAYSPNIILIVVEGLACDDLGCYGGTTIPTPEIDRLADEGARFTQFYAGNSSSAGSQWSLLTALQTTRASQPDLPTLRPSNVTMAEVLWQAGYTTQLVGDTGLAGILDSADPQQHGFDRAYGYDRRENADGYPEYVWVNSDRQSVAENFGSQQTVRGDQLLTTEAAATIERHRRGRPFFLYLTYAQPRASDVDDEDHASLVARVDAHVGSIRQSLQRYGMQRNTIILLTSEGGDVEAAPRTQDNDSPMRASHGKLDEGAIRVPLIVYGPGHVHDGITVDQVYAAWDLLPTLADIVSAWHRPRNIDGVSLRGHLRGKPAENHPYLAWASDAGQAVRIEQWKAIRPSPASPLQLYDLSVDPGETNNVAGQHPDILEQAEQFLASAG